MEDHLATKEQRPEVLESGRQAGKALQNHKGNIW
jgi:hypothetical protein